MRVIAGRFGGRRLQAPKGRATTRPTSDRVREAIFSMLGTLAEEEVLDLFAGTGALGIEALSRGAKRAVFVDHKRGERVTLAYDMIHVVPPQRSPAIVRESPLFDGLGHGRIRADRMK